MDASSVYQTWGNLTWHREPTLRAALVQHLRGREPIFLRVCSSKIGVLDLFVFHNVLSLTGAHRHDIHAFTIFWLRTVHLWKFTIVLQVLFDVQSIILLLILADKIVLLLNGGHIALPLKIFDESVGSPQGDIFVSFYFCQDGFMYRLILKFRWSRILFSYLYLAVCARRNSLIFPLNDLANLLLVFRCSIVCR